jgi:hypothetical protein
MGAYNIPIIGRVTALSILEEMVTECRPSLKFITYGIVEEDSA